MTEKPSAQLVAAQLCKRHQACGFDPCMGRSCKSWTLCGLLPAQNTRCAGCLPRDEKSTQDSLSTAQRKKYTSGSQACTA